jgi:hypothetical protein
MQIFCLIFRPGGYEDGRPDQGNPKGTGIPAMICKGPAKDLQDQSALAHFAIGWPSGLV